MTLPECSCVESTRDVISAWKFRLPKTRLCNLLKLPQNVQSTILSTGFEFSKGAPKLSQPGGIWWPRPEQCHVPVHYIGLMLISASRKCSSTEKDSAKKLHHITFNWRRLSFGLLVFVSLADCFAAPSWFIFCWNFGWISEREKCGLCWQHCHCQVAANLICSSIWFTAR